MSDIRHNWTKEEIGEIYERPLLSLVLDAADMHRRYHKFGEVQISSLLSIKTGGCSEDCSYCPQAARYNTGVKVQALNGRLIGSIDHLGGTMPKGGAKLTSCTITKIQQWVNSGTPNN